MKTKYEYGMYSRLGQRGFRNDSKGSLSQQLNVTKSLIALLLKKVTFKLIACLLAKKQLCDCDCHSETQHTMQYVAYVTST